MRRLICPSGVRSQRYTIPSGSDTHSPHRPCKPEDFAVAGTTMVPFPRIGVFHFFPSRCNWAKVSTPSPYCTVKGVFA